METRTFVNRLNMLIPSIISIRELRIMVYHIETQECSAGGRNGTVYTLKHPLGEAEIWPDHGFNCLRWRVKAGDGLHDVLYSAPDWETNPVPTRSGVPILFPFPNRIREGKYSFGWKDYQLPLNDSTKQNAIHGFAPRHAWRMFGYGIEESGAWIHADFQPSIDAPESVGFWPGDYILSVIYRLTRSSLRVESRVNNVSDTPLPFGLGYHPYFRFPCSDETIDRYKLLAPARSIWECVDNLPTGTRLPVPVAFNFNSTRQLAGTALDTPYTDLGAIAAEPDGLLMRAAIGHTEYPGAVQIWTSPDYGESVLFTPSHRRALCVEPYTCSTDAVNLTARGVEAGWKVLPPGGLWSGVVEFRWAETMDM